jgi:hypothetical protein
MRLPWEQPHESARNHAPAAPKPPAVNRPSENLDPRTVDISKSHDFLHAISNRRNLIFVKKIRGTDRYIVQFNHPIENNDSDAYAVSRDVCGLIFIRTIESELSPTFQWNYDSKLNAQYFWWQLAGNLKKRFCAVPVPASEPNKIGRLIVWVEPYEPDES